MHISPRSFPSSPCTQSTEPGSGLCQVRAAVFWGRTGNKKEPGALQNHYLGFFRLIGVNCFGRLENSTANGKRGCRLKVRCEQRLVIATLTPDAGCALPSGQPLPKARRPSPVQLGLAYLHLSPQQPPSHSYRDRGSPPAATTVLYRESSKKQHLNLLHFRFL